MDSSQRWAVIHFFIMKTVESNYAVSHFSSGIPAVTLYEPWQAQWIGSQAEDNYHPILSKEFTAGPKIRRARLYVTGIDAAKAARMAAVGISDAAGYDSADYRVATFPEILDLDI